MAAAAQYCSSPSLLFTGPDFIMLWSLWRIMVWAHFGNGHLPENGKWASEDCKSKISNKGDSKKKETP